MIDKFWLDLHETRHQWAYDAYSQFVEGIDADLKADYNRSDQVTVVVYGSTQVGKTTLMLDMLGVDRAHAAEVSGVLRGGRTVGKSSTATAMRYRKSESDGWRIGKTGKDLAGGEAEACFAALRAKVESGSDEVPDVVDVYIPRCFFSPAAITLAAEIRLLDLPGLNAANPNEANHVRRVARTYVPIADLIVLVGRADNLGFAHPAALQLPELQDWASHPKRFRVVCTYSFSSASFREWFAEQSRSADDVRARLMKQLRLHDYPLPKALGRYVYPLEFGTSWVDLQQSNAEYFASAKSVVDEVWADFMDSVGRASNPYSRVKMAFEIQQIADRKVSQFRKENTSRREVLASRIASQLSALEVCKKEIGGLDRRIEELDERLETLTNLMSGAWLDSALESAFPQSEIAPAVPESTRPSVLVAVAQEKRRKLRALWGALSERELMMDTPPLREPALSSDRTVDGDVERDSGSPAFILDLGAPPTMRAIDEHIDSLEDHWFDWYSPVFSRFENDFQALVKTVMDVRRTFIATARRKVTAQLTTEQDRLQKERARFKSARIAFASRQERLCTTLDADRAAIEKAAQALEDFEVRMQHSIEHGKRFHDHMTSAHATALSDAERRFHKESDPVKRFYRLLFRKLIEPELQRMMDGENE
ncbi:hypothetical protein FAZ95_00995 [Trinickia violacea]|uniref:Uncharacterized protein n=1 Tax=Trinickia violacea TaxID=2571746 RepID=A0A4P8IGT6_9BURK|nr:hypothetical protein [Trinickia violacea]QCP47882.1 hypothetical protein FAZ95_00995 [Trinickia violacea]